MNGFIIGLVEWISIWMKFEFEFEICLYKLFLMFLIIKN